MEQMVRHMLRTHGGQDIGVPDKLVVINQTICGEVSSRIKGFVPEGVVLEGTGPTEVNKAHTPLDPDPAWIRRQN